MQTRIDRGTISSLKAIIAYFENQGVDDNDEEADQRLMMLSHVERNMAECEKTLLAYQQSWFQSEDRSGARGERRHNR